MSFQTYYVTDPHPDYLEDSCKLWMDHFNFLLSLSFNTEEENAWYKEQFNFNKVYDV